MCFDDLEESTTLRGAIHELGPLAECARREPSRWSPKDATADATQRGRRSWSSPKWRQSCRRTRRCGSCCSSSAAAQLAARASRAATTNTTRPGCGAARRLRRHRQRAARAVSFLLPNTENVPFFRSHLRCIHHGTRLLRYMYMYVGFLHTCRCRSCTRVCVPPGRGPGGGLSFVKSLVSWCRETRCSLQWRLSRAPRGVNGPTAERCTDGVISLHEDDFGQ